MKLQNRVVLILALAALTLAGLATPAHGEVLSMVSKDDEMVMGINARQIVDSVLFKEFMKARPRIKYQMELLEERIGINFLTDLDKVFIYGKNGGPRNGMNNMGLVLKGRINQQRVLAKLAVNPENTTITVYGLTVHTWIDGQEKVTRYGAFLPDGTAIVWPSKEMMERSLNTVRDKTIQMLATPEGKVIPDEDNKSTLWMVMFNPQGRMRTPQNFQFSQASAFLTMGAQDVQARVSIVPKNVEDVQSWVQMMQGALMMFQFQDQNPLLQELVQRTRVSAATDEKSVTITTALGLQNVLDMITGRKNLDDEPDN